MIAPFGLLLLDGAKLQCYASSNIVRQTCASFGAVVSLENPVTPFKRRARAYATPSCSRGAQVGVHSAKTDWSRRILDFQYMDYDDQVAHHA